jgi:hypothetical protein
MRKEKFDCCGLDEAGSVNDSTGLSMVVGKSVTHIAPKLTI